MSYRALLTLLLPFAVVVLPAGAVLAFAPAAAAQAAHVYPFVALAAALLLALRLRRSRAVAAVLALVTAAWALGADAGAAEASAQALLPVSLALLALMRDARAATRRAALQYALVLAPAAACVIAIAAAPDVMERIAAHRWIDPIYTSWSGLEQPALALWLPALVILGARAVRSAHPAEAGLLACAAAALAMLAAATGITERVWLLAAALALVVSLVESSRAMALHDELTGLPARRALNQTLESLRAPYSIAIVDIDHFKTFNDRYGHDVGDQVLRMVAARLERVSGGGTAYRSGGEEFTVVFPGLTRKEAAQHMEAARETVAAAKFTLRAADRPKDQKGVAKRGRTSGREQKLGVTISVGLAEPGARAGTVEAVVKAADKAMYRAKKNGRNRVAV